MKTPEHFVSYNHFSKYILQQALRDREDYLDSITPEYVEPDRETRHIIRETEEEILAIKTRYKYLNTK